MYHKLVLLSSLSLLTACASIVDGKSQSLNVQALDKGRLSHDATCEVTNKRGKWVTASGSSVVVRKAGGSLDVRCESDDGKQVGHAKVESEVQGLYLVGNFFLFDLCTISCIVDFSNGSMYEYQSSIQVPLTHIKSDSEDK